MKTLRDTSITVRMPQAMKDAITRVATSERRTLSQMVAVAMEQFLESRHEWPPKPERRRKAVVARRH
jgi:predicted transcriptional regulator